MRSQLLYNFQKNFGQFRLPLTDDVERVVENHACGPPPGQIHGGRGGPLLHLAVVSRHAVDGPGPGRAVAVRLLAADQVDVAPVRDEGRARAPLLHRSQFAPLSGPETVASFYISG